MVVTHIIECILCRNLFAVARMAIVPSPAKRTYNLQCIVSLLMERSMRMEITPTYHGLECSTKLEYTVRPRGRIEIFADRFHALILRVRGLISDPAVRPMTLPTSLSLIMYSLASGGRRCSKFMHCRRVVVVVFGLASPGETNNQALLIICGEGVHGVAPCAARTG